MSHRRETYSGFSFFQAIPPQIADADVTGEDVDLQGFDSLTFKLNIGALSSITSASYWVLRLQHANESTAASTAGTYSDVDASHVIRDVSTALTSGIVLSIFSDTNFESTILHVGYRGLRRFARVIIEEKANLSTAAFAVEAMLGHPSQWPVNVPAIGND